MEGHHIAVGVMHAVGSGDDVRCNGLVEVVRKRFAVDIRAEVLDICSDACVFVEILACADDGVLTALVGIYATCRRISAILQAGVMRRYVAEAAAFPAKGSRLRPSPEGEVLDAYRQVGRAIDRKEDLLPQNEPLGRRLADHRDKKTTLTAVGVGRMGYVWQVEDRKIQQTKDAVVGACRSVVDKELRRREAPVGVGELAASDGAIVDLVVLR